MAATNREAFGLSLGQSIGSTASHSCDSKGYQPQPYLYMLLLIIVHLHLQFYVSLICGFTGKTAKIKLAVDLEGRKNFKGRLQGVVDSKLIAIEVDGERFDLPYADIARANLVGEV